MKDLNCFVLIQRQMTLKVHIFESFIGDVYGDFSSPAVGERFFSMSTPFSAEACAGEICVGDPPVSSSLFPSSPPIAFLSFPQ